MKKLLLLLIIFFSINTAKSQIEAIKAAAEGAEIIADLVINSGSTGADDLLFLFILDDIFVNSYNFCSYQNRRLMNNPEDYPDAFSFKYQNSFAADGQGTLDMHHKIAGNFGIFGTELRLNYLAEFEGKTAESYKTLDWQILQISMYPSEQLNMKFGTGIIYDTYSSKSYSEFYGSISLFMLDHSAKTTVEYRNATRKHSESLVFNEINLMVEFRLAELEHLSVYGMVGGLYQNYYDVAEKQMIQGGLSFMLN